MTTPIVQCTDTSPAENETGDTLIKVFSPIEVFVTVSVIVYANVNLGLCSPELRLTGTVRCQIHAIQVCDS